MKRSAASGKRANEFCGRIEGGICIVSLLKWHRPLEGGDRFWCRSMSFACHHLAISSAASHGTDIRSHAGAVLGQASAWE